MLRLYFSRGNYKAKTFLYFIWDIEIKEIEREYSDNYLDVLKREGIKDYFMRDKYE